MKPKPTLMVFPGASLARYIAKGELRLRYYNPMNMFGMVVFVTLEDPFVESKAVAENWKMVERSIGSASITLCPLGKPSLKELINPFSNGYYEKLVKQVRFVTELTKPDVIRSYGVGFHANLALVASHTHFAPKKTPTVKPTR